MTRHWGKAGQRLNDQQIEDRARAAVASRNRRAQSTQHHAAEDRMLWAGGKLIPAAITKALDLRELYGPEVDAACGAAEPDVDHWEAGILYPTWEQTLALAGLCGVRVLHFTREPLPWWETTLRFHGDNPLRKRVPLVLRFTQEALAARLTDRP